MPQPPGEGESQVPELNAAHAFVAQIIVAFTPDWSYKEFDLGESLPEPLTQFIQATTCVR